MICERTTCSRSMGKVYALEGQQGRECTGGHRKLLHVKVTLDRHEGKMWRTRPDDERERSTDLES